MNFMALEHRVGTPDKAVTISIVVTNYNYAQFIGQCLDSVMAQTYPHVECIVVDDGSTDASRDIISRYPLVKAVFQANTGQAIAAKNGFKAATGDVVLFLDSDDFLFADACKEVARNWTDDLVAFRYRLQIVKNDRFEHAFWPDDQFLEGEQQLECLFRFGYVPAAPTSGNAYARSYVDLMFREASGLQYNSIDSCLAFSAPIIGETRHSDRALGAYRIHTQNLTAYGRRRPVSGVKLGLFYDYHAQITARKMAHAHKLDLPAWDFLSGAYKLKTYLLTRGVSIAAYDLPSPPAPLRCAHQSARAFLAMKSLSWFRRIANVLIVYGLASAPDRLRRLVGEGFYNMDFAK